MPPISPMSVQQWLDAATERTADTATLLDHRENSVGTVYMAGYVIELTLKALWQVQEKEPPRTHDLRRLWVSAGYRLSDLRDKSGAKSFFFNEWNTSLRYLSQLTGMFSAEELVRAAQAVSGQVRQKIRREYERRGRNR